MALTKEESKELERCKTDPVYWYNTYCKGSDKKKITQDDWNLAIDLFNKIQNKQKSRRYNSGLGKTTKAVSLLSGEPLPEDTNYWKFVYGIDNKNRICKYVGNKWHLLE